MEENILKKLQKLVIDFRNKRNWKKFHKPKDLAISLNLEASEFLELFQWKNDKEIKELINKDKEILGKELADVFYWILLISYDFKIDLVEAFLNKMDENRKKIPN